MYKKWHFYASKEACFNSPQLLHFWKPLQWIPFFEGYPSEEEGGWGFLWGLQIRFQSLGLTRSALAKKFLLKAKSVNFDDDGWSGENDCSWWVVFPHLFQIFQNAVGLYLRITIFDPQGLKSEVNSITMLK